MRRSQAQADVAFVLLSDAYGRHWGYDLSKQSGVRSGVVVPMLHRMLEEGWLTDGWEEPSSEGKRGAPPRRYYELTDEGRRHLGSLVAAIPPRVGARSGASDQTALTEGFV